MPAQRKSLQSQGVPLPDRLPARQNRFATPSERPKTIRRQVVTERSRDPETGLAQEVHTTYEEPRAFAPSRGGGALGRKRRDIDVNVPEGIGLLMAEFFVAMGLLILLFFASGNASLPNRIMTTIKRGTLTCAVFFILALVSGVNPTAAKIAKAIGALVVVALLMSAPIYGTDSSGNPSGVLVDVDELIKNDWAPSASHEATSTSASGTTTSGGPQTPAASLSQLAQDIANSLRGQAQLEGGQKAVTGNPFSNQGVQQSAGNAAVNTLNGIIPGLGDAVGKIFGI